MATVFYLVLVFFSDVVEFSFWWLLISLLFSGNEAKTVYKFTTDPRLDGTTTK
jgi:hypothetical protein